MEKHKSKLPFPDYNAPEKELGQRSKSSVWWTKSLAMYKTEQHNPNWVYMYAKTNVSELEEVPVAFPTISKNPDYSLNNDKFEPSETKKIRPRDAE